VGSRRLLVAVLLGLSVLFVIPAFTHGYIYPTGGDDTAAHLAYFKVMDAQGPNYWGQYLVGKMVNALPFDPVTTFSIFNYAAFVLVIWSVGLATTLVVNPAGGIMAAILVVFGSRVALDQFWSGAIFNLINLGIIFPWLLLCLHNLRKGFGWAIGAGAGGMAFTLFHTDGMYVFALIPVVVACEIWHSKLGRLAQYRFSLYLLALSAVLMAGFLLMPKLYSERLLADAVILVAILIASVVANLHSPLLTLAVIVCAVVAVPNVSLWLQDNSAVKQADKAAIGYLQSQPAGTFSASPEVAEPIYSLFISRKFVSKGYGDYSIVRSVPMTCQSDPKSEWFKNGNRVGYTTLGYTELARFDFGEKDGTTGKPIVVTVYRRK